MKSTGYSESLSWEEALSATVLHSLWQGALIVLLLWFARLVIRRHTRVYHLLSLMGLLILGLSAVLTFLYIRYGGHFGFSEISVASEWMHNPYVTLWITNLWFIGSALFAFRFFFSHLYLRKLILKSHTVTDTSWVHNFQKVKEHYRIRHSVLLLQSEKIGSAFLTGVLRPVVIIPTSWINQLNPKEAECILAHELSHVFNRDHWINLLVHALQILFFFNPAAHLLISQIKLDREIMADASACKYLNSPLLYAKLILRMEETAGMVPLVSLPFLKQRNQLKCRIQSILGLNATRRDLFPVFGLSTLFAFLLLLGESKQSNDSYTSDQKSFSGGYTLSTEANLLPYYQESDYIILQENTPTLRNALPEYSFSRKGHVVSEEKTYKMKIRKATRVKASGKSDPKEELVEAEIHIERKRSVADASSSTSKEDRKSSTNCTQVTITTEAAGSNEGDGWIITRQVRSSASANAPVEPKTIIIIKASPKESTELPGDGLNPGWIKMNDIQNQ
ncbi:MAG TPA: M56 family metallopeptidase [Saprospiraceae bacterium]|nr:M56 family metallopeptidase [Saprospiraceae bacterium]